ncbi:hypothetical protein AX769_12245 [Frondihabitans sp. PAMC 28766]|uniref:hypothetical protein n=1 Tax=Frondihabitans sp. PAMC 28766 TaxID=1795630 RepID=UPI00078E1E40|nr:hypothetical protein [Frondihabitans sp. PAMC 28766]AMM20770.1 hypothetical protein AX769_12245 [Frondihabitans sp. PAMC 28766]
MTTSASRPVPARPAVTPSARRAYAILTGLTVLFIFLQSITAGNLIEDGIPDSAKQTWTDIHGALAYPIMLFALLSAVVAVRSLAAASRVRAFAVILFVATVVQWLSGHAISGLGMDWITPYHVVLAFVIYGLAVWLSVQSARLRRDFA